MYFAFLVLLRIFSVLLALLFVWLLLESLRVLFYCDGSNKHLRPPIKLFGDTENRELLEVAQENKINLLIRSEGAISP